ncbi:hypothetical protein ABZT04_33925 [Streptomyces sp. NPDC005492]|uniref:hypothetical protein n=1 Tax=Streptomyces sp. NPDC005492 TaxID=3156883 RepID=UPI0033A2B592
MLDAESTLHGPAVTHLRLVEDQLRRFRARRAGRQHTTTEQVSLMHKLVSMSDDDHDHLRQVEAWIELARSCGTRSSARRCGTSSTAPSAPSGAG